MTGSLAQIVALACHLNARWRGILTRRFFSDNSTCQFCEWIHFVRATHVQPPQQGELFARTPDEWMERVAGEEFRGAQLIHQSVNKPKSPDRMNAGLVGGGGRWLLCARRKTGIQYWQADWQLGNKKAADQRIWQVDYALLTEQFDAPPKPATVAEVTHQLADALFEIEAFASKQPLGWFGGEFHHALQCLAGQKPHPQFYHHDLAPDGLLGIAPTRLLAACQKAYVFGAMDSWNDMGAVGVQEEDRELYDRLSDRLFDLLNLAICVSVNSASDGTIDPG